MPKKEVHPLTCHRRVESVSHIGDVTLSKRALMRVDSKRKVLLTLVCVGIRRRWRAKQTEANCLTFDSPPILALAKESASVAKVVRN